MDWASFLLWAVFGRGLHETRALNRMVSVEELHACNSFGTWIGNQCNSMGSIILVVNIPVTNVAKLD